MLLLDHKVRAQMASLDVDVRSLDLCPDVLTQRSQMDCIRCEDSQGSCIQSCRVDSVYRMVFAVSTSYLGDGCWLDHILHLKMLLKVRLITFVMLVFAEC